MIELDKIKAAIAYREERMRQHREEIVYHNSMIDIHLKFQREAEKRMKHFFKDSGMLPYNLMTDSDKAKIDRMPRSTKPCAYCYSDDVREGKKHVCMTCQHDNTPEPK